MIGDRLRVGVGAVCLAACAAFFFVAHALTDGIEEW